MVKGGEARRSQTPGPSRTAEGIQTSSHSTFSIHQSPFERRTTLASLLVFGAALVLYVTTLAPGLLWGGGDFARFQTWAYLGHIEGKVDIFAHPLWVYVAHPFTWLPIRDPAWRANFASAVFAATALVFVFLSAGFLTRLRPAALLATAALAVSHTFWTYAVMPKVYSLNALLLAACIYLLLRWRATSNERCLALFGLLFGLSLLNHLVMATAAAGFAVFTIVTLWTHRRPVGRALLIATASFGIGLAPYIYLMLRSTTAGATSDTVARFVVGLAYAFSHPTVLLKGCAWGVALGLYQFPLSTVAGVLGLLLLWQRDIAMAAGISLIMLGTVAFLLGALDPHAGSTYVWNLHYYMQAYVAFALGMAPGFEILWTRWCSHVLYRQAALMAATLIVPLVLYVGAPTVAPRLVRDIPDFRPLPGRDNFAYVLSPWKQNEIGARTYGERMLKALPEGSVLFADYGPWAIVRYLQVVEHARPDVELVELGSVDAQVGLIRRHGENPNLFLADTYRYYDLDGIRQHFDIVPAGPIYRLVPKSPSRNWSDNRQQRTDSRPILDADRD